MRRREEYCVGASCNRLVYQGTVLINRHGQRSRPQRGAIRNAWRIFDSHSGHTRTCKNAGDDFQSLGETLRNHDSVRFRRTPRTRPRYAASSLRSSIRPSRVHIRASSLGRS